ncbi:efflux RND transporter permease subunit [Idiomarina loihiensis]|jgi:multidrug efflux pump|uniref:RND family efflux transporter n=1 Tax=Idiomarina loihiensis (strain ATCC BAA-735 / DSM 15497 / L2-TR) TaxID=283942 RepID=Q5QVV8_IDILO|nr:MULTISPECIES: efflux RND transporter permease subunit [Idiomarina]NWO03676.1 efflux RND transporter permease subunit [Idiomarinaceae bacterium]AAV83136.1 RND family efflux transporter [Idiomarina loihiensis L2TR]AGM37181.1 RND family efflux transporter [Idiomarina loihiensis GSL 199]MRJ45574.1 MMPL family transporter [Idiomarina loihiensis]PHQ88439.1 MAG: AcrB/AcrD/AcrF family protein [Idiomarina sp.]|tara:strand:- start:3999 stop:7097 length:3099 start_codon:yes stop_codon:yes gene_type:complete
MLLSDLSVKRPVFATVLNILLVVFGIVAFTMLPLREYPDIDRPIVTIDTDYPGASAEVVETQVTQLVEDRISGIEGIKNISSSSRNGRSSISIEFNLTRDIDAASNDVRERVSRVLDNLPEEADPPEVSKASSDESTIVWYNLRSESMSILELTDYAERYIVDRLSVADGVARVVIGGDRRYAMRVWLDRDAMAARQVTVTDIVSRLREENVELPAGEVESTDREFSVRMARAYLSPEDFKNLVIRQGDDGYLVRLGEVARVELGAEDDKTDFRGNGVNMVGVGVIKQSKGNTLDVVKNVHREMKKIQETLPETMYLAPSYDSSIFIQGSVDEVYNTLAVAMALVIVVIYLFLGNIRATIVPALTVPVAIIASYMVLFALGFSINLLTLLALVLAIGLVVDDSIVVLENIYRRIEEGEPPVLAAYRGAREVGFAVIATTLVLISVFVPLAFLDGNIGKLFTEFALAIAAAVAFSSIAALTLTPMLSSKILSKKERTSKFGKAFDATFNWLEQGYRGVLEKSVKRPMMAIVLVVMSGVVAFGLFSFIPQEFAPPEDRGTFYIQVRSAEGASFESSSRHMDEIEQILLPYIDEGKIDRLIVRAPGWGGSAGIAIVGAVPFDERDWSSFDLMEEMRSQLDSVVGVQAFAFMRSGISGGGGRPVEFVLQGNTYERLAEFRDIVIEEASTNPGLQDLDSDYKETLPQLLIQVDEASAADLGVSVQDIGITLQSVLGQRRVTTYLDRGEEYDVMLEGEKADYRSPSAIDNIYVRSRKSDELIPLSNLVTITEQATSARLNRYNRMRSVTIEANLAEGYSLGEALSYLEGVVQEKLPEDVSIDYKGESQLYKESGSSIVFVFGLALVITFLVLAAQFESFIHPLVIMLAVPMAIVGALMALYLAGMSINIYSQIGIVMLIGLAAKNGILIVEFANQLRDSGVEFKEAVLKAAQQRLRPIVMTAFTTLMSSVPLILGSGPGAESRMVIGTVIFAGVAVSAFLTLFVIPALYIALAKNTSSPMAITRKLESLQEEYPDHHS